MFIGINPSVYVILGSFEKCPPEWTGTRIISNSKGRAGQGQMNILWLVCVRAFLSIINKTIKRTEHGVTAVHQRRSKAVAGCSLQMVLSVLSCFKRWCCEEVASLVSALGWGASLGWPLSQDPSVMFPHCPGRIHLTHALLGTLSAFFQLLGIGMCQAGSSCLFPRHIPQCGCMCIYESMEREGTPKQTWEEVGLSSLKIRM